MAQVLKEDVRQNIFDAAMEVFYEKDFQSSTVREIASRAGVTGGLLYSYYANKEALYAAVVSGVMECIESVLLSDSWWNSGFDGISEVSLDALMVLYERPRRLVILMDKSAGTPFAYSRADLLRLVGVQISRILRLRGRGPYDPVFIDMLSHHFAENLVEIARQFKTLSWAREMLVLVMRAYFGGIKAL